MHPSSRPQPGTTRMSKMLRDGFRLIIVTTLSFMSFVAHAGEWIADAKTGCQVWNPAPSPGESISWSGPCSNGKATGTGTLQWYLRACLRSSKQQSQKCQIHELQAGVEPAFAIFPQTPIFLQPSKAALDHPALWNDRKLV